MPAWLVGTSAGGTQPFGLVCSSCPHSTIQDFAQQTLDPFSNNAAVVCDAVCLLAEVRAQPQSRGGAIVETLKQCQSPFCSVAFKASSSTAIIRSRHIISGNLTQIKNFLYCFE